MAPPGTSIDWSAFMNASVRRLTSSSLGAPTICGKAACTSLKMSFATSGGRHRRGGFVPVAGAAGAAGGSAVESKRTVRWAWSRGCGRIEGGVEV